MMTAIWGSRKPCPKDPKTGFNLVIYVESYPAACSEQSNLDFFRSIGVWELLILKTINV